MTKAPARSVLTGLELMFLQANIPVAILPRS